MHDFDVSKCDLSNFDQSKRALGVGAWYWANLGSDLPFCAVLRFLRLSAILNVLRFLHEKTPLSAVFFFLR